MSLIIPLSNLDAEQITFCYSSVWELFLSLHTLLNGKYHPLHISWILQMKNVMNQELKREIQLFGILYDKKITSLFYDIWLPAPGIQSFEEGIAALREISPNDYAGQIITHLFRLRKNDPTSTRSLREVLVDKDVYEETLDITRSVYPESLAMVQELLVSPEISRDRFINMLIAYREICMRSEWHQFEEVLLEDIQQRTFLLIERGAEALLRSLAPNLHVYTEDDRIILQYPFYRNITLPPSSRLLLIPSYFVWPRLLAGGNNGTFLIYAAQLFQKEGKVPLPPEKLLNVLKAVSDMTRLQILQLISQKERSTHEISELIGLSDGGVSKHLKILQDAGLVESRRSSYYVLYYIVHEHIAEIGQGLEKIVGTSSVHKFSYRHEEFSHFRRPL